LAPELGIR